MSRPYGIGLYGTGPYSRDAAGSHAYEVGGQTGVVFAAAGIASRTISPQAITEIVFSVSAPLEMTWPGWAPCETGGWAATDGCAPGTWTAPGICGSGSWTGTTLP